MALDVEIEDEAWTAVLSNVEAVVRRAAEVALATEPSRAGHDLVVLLTDDETVRDLNARFRGKDRPTNVLSFPAPEMPGMQGPGGQVAVLGDIVLAHGVCAREALEQAKALDSHLAHLVVHGVLHLLGRDHEVDADAEAMEAEERAILASLGISDPYELPHDD